MTPSNSRPARRTNQADVPSVSSRAATPRTARHPCASVPNTAPPLRLSATEVEAMRQKLHATRPFLGPALLQAFVHRVFADDLMVECYCRQLRIEGPAQNPGWWRRNLVPLNAALQASDRAASMEKLLPHERDAARLAAFLYPCGLFHCVHPWVRQMNSERTPDLAYSRTLTAELLADALRWLRGHSPVFGVTLSAVFGGDTGQANAEQVARLQAAVVLANVSVTEQWAPRGIVQPARA